MAAAREWSQPLRGNKFLGLEGGVRVSCAVWWENGNARGGRKIDELNTWSQSGTIAMLRMGRYKLVYDMLGHGELYDMEKDPSEIKIRQNPRDNAGGTPEMGNRHRGPSPCPEKQAILSHPPALHITVGQYGETRCLLSHQFDSP